MDVQLFDTTLRDGTQSEGLSLSVEDKLKISRLLDGFGIHFIEGGYPGSNPKDVEFFQRAKSLSLKHAKLTAFGMTRKAGGQTATDPVLRAIECAWPGGRMMTWPAETSKRPASVSHHPLPFEHTMTTACWMGALRDRPCDCASGK